ncbi:hypothetical protein ENBRE01_2523 [Enteropsectra breve]|nr:hypothetical protein ENBRE01_2523 [Enteropsectra breve]
MIRDIFRWTTPRWIFSTVFLSFWIMPTVVGILGQALTLAFVFLAGSFSVAVAYGNSLNFEDEPDAETRRNRRRNRASDKTADIVDIAVEMGIERDQSSAKLIKCETEQETVKVGDNTSKLGEEKQTKVFEDKELESVFKNELSPETKNAVTVELGVQDESVKIEDGDAIEYANSARRVVHKILGITYKVMEIAIAILSIIFFYHMSRTMMKLAFISLSHSVSASMAARLDLITSWLKIDIQNYGASILLYPCIGAAVFFKHIRTPMVFLAAIGVFLTIKDFLVAEKELDKYSTTKRPSGGSLFTTDGFNNIINTVDNVSFAIGAIFAICTRPFKFFKAPTGCPRKIFCIESAVSTVIMLVVPVVGIMLWKNTLNAADFGTLLSKLLVMHHSFWLFWCLGIASILGAVYNLDHINNEMRVLFNTESTVASLGFKLMIVGASKILSLLFDSLSFSECTIFSISAFMGIFARFVIGPLIIQTRKYKLGKMGKMMYFCVAASALVWLGMAFAFVSGYTPEWRLEMPTIRYHPQKEPGFMAKMEHSIAETYMNYFHGS